MSCFATFSATNNIIPRMVNFAPKPYGSGLIIYLLSAITMIALSRLPIKQRRDFTDLSERKPFSSSLAHETVQGACIIVACAMLTRW